MTISSQNTGYCPIMVDCETLGLTPNRNPVLQIAMVSFCPETFEPKEAFEIFLPMAEQLAKGNVVEQSTLDWWSKQNPKVVSHIAKGIEDAKTMDVSLVELYKWVESQTQKYLKNAKKKPDVVKSLFWAKPTLFDYPFIEGLFRQHKQISPFHYQQVMDMKSYLMGMFQTAFFLTYKYQLPHGVAQDMYWLFNDYSKIKNPKVEDDAHNATADCYYQIEWLQWSQLNLDKILEHFDQHGDVKSFLKSNECV